MTIYLLMIVADLGLDTVPRDYSKPVVAFTSIEVCRYAVEFHTKNETKSFITYRCQEIQVVK